MAVTSGIKTVSVLINGQSYTLTKNNATGKYETTITAPTKSSFNNNSGHYFPVKLTAQDQAGNVVTADDNHVTLGASLKLKVKELTAPTIGNITPTAGAYLATQAPTITAEFRDNDSGVDITSLILKVDETIVPNSDVTHNSVSGGYNISYTPKKALIDGPHTVTIQISDNDGNQSTEARTNFTVMATAPTLTVSAPADSFKTKESRLTVSGTTNSDAKITIQLNGADQGSVNVGSGGAFTKDITLSTEGSNTIKVIATNLAGVTTEVDRTVIYDTTAPVISAVTINPNPVDAGKTYTISVTVTD